MVALWFWLILFLLVAFFATLPAWPYSRRWGYCPSSVALIISAVFLALISLGFLSIS